MKSIELEKYLNESRNIYFNNHSRGYNTLVSIFSDLSKIPYEKSENIIEEHLYYKFLNSNSKNFDRFLKSYLGEEGVQISANIPQSVRPEKPVEEKDDLEEKDDSEESKDETPKESDSDEESKDEETDDDLSEDDTIIENFLDEIGLLHLEEEEVERFIYRFVYVLEDTFEDKETLNLIASLLYKARMKPEDLTDGDRDELTDIIFHLSMNPDDENATSNESNSKEESYVRDIYNLDSQIFTLMSEADKDEGDIKSKTKSAVHKVGVVSVLAGSAFLFGLGGLFAAGLFLFLTRSSDEDLEKTKEKCTESKDEIASGKPPKIDNPKPVNNPSPPPKDSIKDIESKGESSKTNLVDKAKEVASKDPNFAKKQEAKATWKDRFKSAAKYVGSKGVDLLGKGASAVGNAVSSAAEAGYDSAKTAVVSAYNSGSEWAKTTGAELVKSGWEATKSGVDKATKYVGDKASKGAKYVGDKIDDVKNKFKGDSEKDKDSDGKDKKAKSPSKKKDVAGKGEVGTKVTSKGDAQKYFDVKGKAPKGWESDPNTGKVYKKGSKPPTKKKPTTKKKPPVKKPKKEENYLYNLIF